MEPTETQTTQTPFVRPLFAIVDIETGGFSKTKNGLAEIGILIMNRHDVVHFKQTWLIKPYPRMEADQETPGQLVSYKEDAMKVNGLTVEKLEAEGKEATEVALVLQHVLESYEIDTLVGHNIKAFDWPWIDHFLARFGKAERDSCRITGLLDTMLLAREQHKGLKSYALQDLCAHFEITTGDQHRSGGDIEATRCLLMKLAGGELGGVRDVFSRKVITVA